MFLFSPLSTPCFIFRFSCPKWKKDVSFLKNGGGGDISIFSGPLSFQSVIWCKKFPTVLYSCQHRLSSFCSWQGGLKGKPLMSPLYTFIIKNSDTASFYNILIRRKIIECCRGLRVVKWTLKINLWFKLLKIWQELSCKLKSVCLEAHGIGFSFAVL